MRRDRELPKACPFHDLLEVLARPWTMHILWTLSTQGPTRFGELRRHVAGISSRVLTERLRVLEEKGFVFRNYKPTIPPAVTYGITSRMKDISKVLDELNELAKKWQQEDAHVRAKPETGRASPPSIHSHQPTIRQTTHP
ncbi:MAG: winged helix-turn-helix transcriptional regulator [Terriglobia bacterium]